MQFRSVRRSLPIAAFAGAALLMASETLVAQAWVYPAFQPPAIVDREYQGIISDGDWGGTSLVFQWREGIGPRSQFSVDAGIADPDFADARFLIGGGYGYQLNNASQNEDMPLDMMLTAGAYGSFGDGLTIIRVPVGVSIGRRFPLDGNLAITPYVHPRAALFFCSDCADETDMRINFDIGADFEVTQTLSIRGSIMLGGDDEEAFGLGLAWRPRGLR